MATSTTTTLATTTTEVAATLPVSTPQARTDDFFLPYDGAVRSAAVRVPARLLGDKVPLVLALHGSDGSGRGLEELSGYDEVADREGFIVAYADGLPIDIGVGFISRSWNSGECCYPATTAGVNDVGYLSSLIDGLIARYPIEPKKVFVVGHSNGAIMAQMLGCELAGKIAAIASVAGALDDTGPCAPSRPVPFFEIHGTDDEDVAWSAGQNGVNMWRRFNRCFGAATIDRVPAITATRWTGCAGNSTVWFTTIEGAQHPWPGQRTMPPDGKPVSQLLDAAEATWTFFASVASRTA